jgi:segregation and condensation protein A
LTPPAEHKTGRVHPAEPLSNDAEDMDDPSSEFSSYQVKLEVFEGPLELLLHLIKQNKLNITDIPIALITREYLDYLGLMKSLNLNVAGEFIVMASTLIHIKSKMLLPPDVTEEDEEAGDPREELVRRLVDYKRFRDAAETLEGRELAWKGVFRRKSPPTQDEGEDAVPLTDLSLFDLLDALRALLERIPEKRDIDVIVDELSVKDRMAEIRQRLTAGSSMTFDELFENQASRDHIIVTFLAVLELIRISAIRVEQTNLFEPIRIIARDPGEAIVRPYEIPEYGGEG